MAQFGSNPSVASQAFVNLLDQAGNPLVSTNSGFGSSPLGIAPLTQAFFGLPNATFNLTPPDTLSVIDGSNPLPYWDVENSSSQVMSATSVFDSTTETWGIKLDPGTATTGDYLTLKTRSYLVNDDNIALRQKAFSTIAKNGTYGGSTQWNLQLSATYYSAADTALHTAVIGTALDNATWTTINGFTTTGGTAIAAAARYVDIALTLTATAPVTSATSVTIKSVLLSTSSGAASSTSFLIKQTFTASTVWSVPTGVTQLVAAIAVGGGGGGGAGMFVYNSNNGASGSCVVSGGAGGGAGALYIAQGIPVSGTSVTVSVGAGSSGGTAGAGTTTVTGTANVRINQIGGAGAAGGASSFGTQMTANGGSGGGGGTFYYAAPSANFPGTAAAGTGGTVATLIWGALTQNGVAGGKGAGAGSAAADISNATVGSTSGLSTYAAVPFIELPGAGTAGGNATNTAGTTGGTARWYRPDLGTGAAGGATQFSGGGGGGGGGSARYLDSTATALTTLTTPAAGGLGGSGGGGAGALWAGGIASSAGTMLAGNGGNAAPYSGGGGGGGGGLGLVGPNSGSAVTMRAGSGGAGADGAVYIWYVG